MMCVARASFARTVSMFLLICRSILSPLASRGLGSLLAGTICLVVMFSPRAESADFVVDDSLRTSDASGTIRLMHRDRIASFGDIAVTHYADLEYSKDATPGTHHIVIENMSTGDRSTVALPGMSHVAYPFTDAYQLEQSGQYVTVDFAGHAMTSETDLWILAQTTDGDNGLSRLHLQHYRLDGSPMPDRATLVARHPLGNAFSRVHGLVRLDSGALVATWFQHEDGAGTDELVLGFGYRSPSGSVSQNFPVNVPSGSSTGEGRYSKSRYAAAQHPVTKDLWVFSKRDSSGQLQALRLQESGGELVVAEIMPRFINRAQHEKDGPEGEWPDLHARAIPSRETIQLIYHRNDYQIWSGTTDSNISWFKKGARLGLAEIADDGTVDFATQRFPDFVERITRFGMSSTDDATWVLYQRVDSTYPVTTISDYAVRFDNSERTWGTPIRVDDARSSMGEFGVARPGMNGRYRFLTRQKNDGQIHQLEIANPTANSWLSSFEHVAVGTKFKLRWTTTADSSDTVFTALRNVRGDKKLFEVLDLTPESDGVRWYVDVEACSGCHYRIAKLDGKSEKQYSVVIAEGGSFNNEGSVIPATPEPTSLPEPATAPATPPASPPATPVTPATPQPDPEQPPTTVATTEPEVESLDPSEIFDATEVSRKRIRLKWYTVPFADVYYLERGSFKYGAMHWKKVATTYGSRAKFRDKRKTGTWWYRVQARQFTNELKPSYSPTIKIIVE